MYRQVGGFVDGMMLLWTVGVRELVGWRMLVIDGRKSFASFSHTSTLPAIIQTVTS